MKDVVDTAELLTHAGWVRALARHLCREDDAAADLEQDTWVAALAHPPRAGRDARPWLAEVLRNARRQRHRKEVRRASREQQVVLEPVATTDEALIELELTRRLADEVGKLDEPYRTTLVDHYYRGLRSTEIAARDGVAAGTIRWRLKEAIDRLRVQLDRTYGDRARWKRALVPFAAPASATKGALMLKVVLASLCAVAIGAGAYLHHEHAVAAAVSSAPASEPSTATIQRTLPSSAGRESSRRSHDALAARIVAAQRAASRATGQPTATLDADYITDQLRMFSRRLEWCYEQQLVSQPTLRGTLMVRFTIVADPELGGVVSDSAVEPDKSTLKSEPMGACVEQVVYDTRFDPPAADGTVEVEQPFVFAPME